MSGTLLHTPHIKLFSFLPKPCEIGPSFILILEMTTQTYKGWPSLSHVVNETDLHSNSRLPGSRCCLLSWTSCLPWKAEYNNLWPSIFQTFLRSRQPSYRKAEWASERWSDIFKDTELARGSSMLWNQFAVPPSLLSFDHTQKLVPWTWSGKRSSEFELTLVPANILSFWILFPFRMHRLWRGPELMSNTDIPLYFSNLPSSFDRIFIWPLLGDYIGRPKMGAH